MERRTLMRLRLLCLITLAVLWYLLSLSNVIAGGRPLGADLSGDAEVPGPGAAAGVPPRARPDRSSAAAAGSLSRNP